MANITVYQKTHQREHKFTHSDGSQTNIDFVRANVIEGTKTPISRYA